MHFKILGPLEIRVNEQEIPLNGARQRAVMAGLLLEANRVIPTNRLIKLLWDTQPPATAKEQVQNVVSAVRRTLERWSPLAGTVVTRPSGYMAVAPTDQLDAARFQELSAQARATVANDPPTALGMYHAALALWRGPALAGLGNEVVHAAAVRLDEERLVTLEERLELELELGGARNIVGDLQALTMEHPLRERPRGMLMLALYRTGRTAEALTVFRTTRRMFIEELGLEPSDQLRRLEQQILSKDPDLLRARSRGSGGRPAPPSGAAVEPVSAPVAPPTTRPAPEAAARQLPVSFTAMVGRQEETKAAGDHLLSGVAGDRSDPAICVIAGPPGIGKTELALRVARLVSGSFAGGYLYAGLHDLEDRPAAPQVVLRRFLTALGQPEPTADTSIDAMIDTYHSTVSGRSLLIVLDDVRDEAQVRGLLPLNGNCSVLITSRRPLTALTQARNILLGPFDEERGVAMLPH